MSAPAPDNSIDGYIKAAVEASTRSRYVALLLLTASILTIMAVWNASPLSSQLTLGQAHREVLRFWPLSRSVEQQEGPGSLHRIQTARKFAAKLFREDETKWTAGTITTNKLAEYKLRLDEVNKDLTKANMELAMIVKLPFYGTGFNVNDLPIFSGVGLVSLLSMFWFSLHREAENLELLRKVAGERKQTVFAREVLAMHQVLFIPPNTKPVHAGVFRLLLQGLLLFPFLAYISVFLLQFDNLPLGLAIEPVGTWVKLGFAFVVMCFIGYQVRQCFNCDHAMGAMWNAWSKDVDEPQKVGHAGESK